MSLDQTSSARSSDRLPILEHQDEPLLDTEDYPPVAPHIQRNENDFEDLELGNSSFLIDTSSSFDRQSLRAEREKTNLRSTNIFDDL
jgi:hypothetical protein